MFLITSDNPEAAKQFIRDVVAESFKAASLVQSEDQILDVPAMAEWLRCEPDTIRDMARAKRIPFIRPGKNYLFIKSEILEWLKSHKRPVIN